MIGSVPLEAVVLEETPGRPRLLALAKSVLSRHPATARLTDAVAVSSLTGAGIDRLVATLSDEVQRRASSEGDEGGIVASLRQTEALAALQRSRAGAEQALGRAPLEVALVDLRDALTQADGLLGIDTGAAVLDRIFSTFCLGK